MVIDFWVDTIFLSVYKYVTWPFSHIVSDKYAVILFVSSHVTSPLSLTFVNIGFEKFDLVCIRIVILCFFLEFVEILASVDLQLSNLEDFQLFFLQIVCVLAESNYMYITSFEVFLNSPILCSFLKSSLSSLCFILYHINYHALKCWEPAHEIPPKTRSWGGDLTSKADQDFRGFEKLPRRSP